LQKANVDDVLTAQEAIDYLKMLSIIYKWSADLFNPSSPEYNEFISRSETAMKLASDMELKNNNCNLFTKESTPMRSFLKVNKPDSRQ
jgi:hypothetical protein